MGDAGLVWAGVWLADGGEVVDSEGPVWEAILGRSKNSLELSITSSERPTAEVCGGIAMKPPGRLVGAEPAGRARVAAKVGKRDDPDPDTPCPRALHTAAVTVSCMLTLPTLRAELCSAARGRERGSLRWLPLAGLVSRGWWAEFGRERGGLVVAGDSVEMGEGWEGRLREEGEGGLGRMTRPLAAACSKVLWYLCMNSWNTDTSGRSQGSNNL